MISSAYAGIKLLTNPGSPEQTSTSSQVEKSHDKPSNLNSGTNKVDYEVELKSENLAADIREAMTDEDSKQMDEEQASPDDSDDFHELEDLALGLRCSLPDDRVDAAGNERGSQQELSDSSRNTTISSNKGHKYNSSIDSGYQGSTKGGLQAKLDICSGESSADESVIQSNSTSPISEISKCKESDTMSKVQRNTCDANDDKLEASLEECSSDNTKHDRPNLNLNLNALHRRNRPSTLSRSPSSPIINSLHQKLHLKERLKIQSPVSPSSPFLGTDGILNATTPTYAKIRHFAQSPVQHFRHFPISRNPYMSPYLADPELLMGLCPVYFVVSDSRDYFVLVRLVLR